MFDCRSLIRMRTNADKLLSKPLFGWVSMYSSSSTSDEIVAPVPKKDVAPTREILKARGGFVDAATRKGWLRTETKPQETEKQKKPSKQKKQEYTAAPAPTATKQM